MYIAKILVLQPTWYGQPFQCSLSTWLSSSLTLAWVCPKTRFFYDFTTMIITRPIKKQIKLHFEYWSFDLIDQHWSAPQPRSMEVSRCPKSWGYPISSSISEFPMSPMGITIDGNINESKGPPATVSGKGKSSNSRVQTAACNAPLQRLNR